MTTAYAEAQSAGDLNAVVIGWSDSTGNVTSVTDSQGNAYQLAAATTHGNGVSQAIYYAKDITAATAASNKVTVKFDTAVSFADIRVLEYSGLDRTSPLDVTHSAAGTSASANSGSATTAFASELALGTGATTGGFGGPGIRIHQPDRDQPGCRHRPGSRCAGGRLL